MPYANRTVESRHLLFIGLVMLKADTALLYYHDNNYLIYMIAIAIHVDNFLWSETNYFKTNFILKLPNKFMFGKEVQSIFQPF